MFVIREEQIVETHYCGVASNASEHRKIIEHQLVDLTANLSGILTNFGR